MQRVKFVLSYDGNFFYGFQRQKDNSLYKTVAGSIEEALKKLGIFNSFIGAGRTDAGVHAFGQVAHCDIPLFWKDFIKLAYLLNTMLHPYIHIKHIEKVDDSFHARFSAKKRLYRYILYDGNYQPFLSSYALHIKKLDIMELNKYTQLLSGTHDFSFLKKEGGGATQSIRTLFKTGVYKYNNCCILYFQGDAFLRSQVRMMVHLILEACAGKITQEQFLEQRDTKKKHLTHLSPACGLYLSRIYY